ncbi:hypothetical protein O6H91_01G022900 [Diphasiastrum complanatum]|uniref:Uncharacterized protein n=1 Tax=Diphasiastrum complanatum TaxID=34168 RepID=A0ACC2EP43_DIPCM|nr:hypothetical protein O6H91_Y407000 [Diphasiastrum complanatum]KAJ7568202.1 hypothetical protein O6H91_01G022900 [Diphasiastrum complanatum]
MPLTSSAVDVFGLATLVLTILLSGLGVLCAIYVLHFRSKVHDIKNALALREFNSPWLLRMVLIACATLWSVLEILRLPLLKKHGWLLHSLSFHWQAIFCKLYLILSLGIAEPAFFLTAAFLIFGPLHGAPFSPQKRWRCKKISLFLGCTLPTFFLQLLVIIMMPFLESTDNKGNDGYEGLPPYFTRAFESVERGSTHIAVCTFPLFSTLVLGFFALLYIVSFLFLGWRVMLILINRKLQIRMYCLVLIVVLFLPMHVVFLGLSALSRPREVMFEVVGFLAFLSLLMCVSVGEGILVIRPIADALALHWIQSERTTLTRQQSWGSIPIDHIATPLQVFGIEDEESVGVERLGLLREAVENADLHKSVYSSYTFPRPDS